MKTTDITVEMLRATLRYESETGHLYRLRGGKRITCLDSGGYIVVGVNKVSLKAHRVAFAIAKGRWPSAHLDHVNQCKTDNRLANLRECTVAENLRNRPALKRNTSGFTGVSLIAKTKKWLAQISVDSKTIHLGHFVRAEQAAIAYAVAAIKHHSVFASAHVIDAASALAGYDLLAHK